MAWSSVWSGSVWGERAIAAAAIAVVAWLIKRWINGGVCAYNRFNTNLKGKVAIVTVLHAPAHTYDSTNRRATT